MTLPRARVENLVVKHVADETLVYDLQRDHAHCLNAAAGLIWSHCDGHTDVDQMATVLQTELGLPPDERVVWLGLRDLDKAHLLLEPMEPPLLAASYSRREFLKKTGMVGIAAVLFPTVNSIVSPIAAQVGSCIDDCTGASKGTPCPLSGGNPCVKICCSGNCRQPAHNDCIC